MHLRQRSKNACVAKLDVARFNILRQIYGYILRHPDVNVKILDKIAPQTLQTSIECLVALELASYPKLPGRLNDHLANLIFEAQATDADTYEIALRLCCRKDTEVETIQKILGVRGINSAFRSKLYHATTRPKIKKILEKIRDENKRKQEFSSKPKKQPEPPAPVSFQPADPAPVTPPARDPRLLGAWSWMESSGSSLGFSAFVEESYVFANDGRFIRSSRSSATNNTLDDRGNWLMSNDVAYYPVGDRGTWETRAGKLYLNWDDGMYSEFDYRLYSGALELITDRSRRVYSFG